MRRADRAVIRPGPMALVPPSFVALTSLVYGSVAHWAFWLILPVGVLGVLLVVRTRTVLSPEGLETCDGLRVRRVPWADLASVAPRLRGAAAVTADGVRVPLPAVVWAGPRRKTAAYVVDWAAGHGHVLTLGA